MYYNEGKSSDAAQQFRMITDKVPFHSTAQLLLGEIYYSNKSYQEAIDALTHAVDYGFIDKTNRFDVYYKISASYYNLRDYEKSLQYAHEALSLKGGDFDTLMLLSAVDIKLEKYDEALSSLSKLSAIDPNNADIQYQLGSIHYKMGDTDKYTAAFSKLFAIISKESSYSPKYQKAMVLLSTYEYNLKSYKRTTEIIDIIPADSRDYETRIIHARSLYQIKEYARAASVLESISLQNEDKFLLCRSYVKSGNREKGKTLLASMILYNNTLQSTALADSILAPLAKEILASNNQQSQPAPIVPPVPAPATNSPAQ